MDPVSFRKFLAVLKRQWWVILQAMVVVGLAAGWQASRVPRGAVSGVCVGAGPRRYGRRRHLAVPSATRRPSCEPRSRALTGTGRDRSRRGATAQMCPPTSSRRSSGSTEEYSSTFTVHGDELRPRPRHRGRQRLRRVVRRDPERGPDRHARTQRAAQIEQQLVDSQARVTDLTEPDQHRDLLASRMLLPSRREKEAELRRYQGLFDQQQAVLTQAATQPKAAELLERRSTPSQPPGAERPDASRARRCSRVVHRRRACRRPVSCSTTRSAHPATPPRSQERQSSRSCRERTQRAAPIAARSPTSPNEPWPRRSVRCARACGSSAPTSRCERSP